MNLICQIYFWNKTLHVSDSSSVVHQEDDGQRNCPTHVEFYSKNKSEELVHIAGFIIRIYHDARSPGRQICGLVTYGFTGTASYKYVHPCNSVSLFPVYSKFLHSVFCCGKL
jgi:hypothetical protein